MNENDLNIRKWMGQMKPEDVKGERCKRDGRGKNLVKQRALAFKRVKGK